MTDTTHDLEKALSEALQAATDPENRFLGLGVDVVKVERFRADRKRWGSAFLDKAFTKSEAQYCKASKDRDETYAGTFAAKEAVFKALGLEWKDAFSWHWIEIYRDHKRLPTAMCSRELIAQRPDIAKATVRLSITHAGEYAAAVALVLS